MIKKVIEAVRDYVQDNMHITVFTNTQTREKRFVGHGTIAVQMNPNMPPNRMALDFDIESEGLQDAFDKYQEVATEAAEKAKDEIMEQMTGKKIITPNNIDPGIFKDIAEGKIKFENK